MRQVILYPGVDGYWVVECPSLPGCISQGKTKAEAEVNIREAIEGYEAALEDIEADTKFIDDDETLRRGLPRRTNDPEYEVEKLLLRKKKRP